MGKIFKLFKVLNGTRTPPNVFAFAAQSQKPPPQGAVDFWAKPNRRFTSQMLINLTQLQSVIHKYCKELSLDENRVIHNLTIEDLRDYAVYPQFFHNLFQIDDSNYQFLSYTSRWPHELAASHAIPPRKTACKVSLDVNHPLSLWQPPCAWEGFAALDYDIAAPCLDKNALTRDDEAAMRCVQPHLKPIAALAHCYGSTCGSAAWAVMCAGYPVYWGQLIGWLDQPIVPEMDEQFAADLAALKEATLNT